MYVDSQLFSGVHNITIPQTSALMREREAAQIASGWRCTGILMSGSCDRSNGAEKPLNSSREKREMTEKLCAQCHKTHIKKIKEFSGISGRRVIVCLCSCCVCAHVNVWQSNLIFLQLWVIQLLGKTFRISV